MDQPIPEIAQQINPVDLAIIEEIASGRPAAEVAGMLGLTLLEIQQHVTRLRSDIQARGRALRSERIEETYAQTEEKILRRIKKEAEDDLAEVGPLIRALEVIAKNRVSYRNPAGMVQPNLGGTQNILINVNLPAAAVDVPHVTLNSRAEIIAVGNRNMSALPLEGVQKIFADFDKAKGVNYETDHAFTDNVSAATASA